MQKWNWPHSRGWTGITIDDCWKGWAILLRQKQKKLIMLPSETMIWQPEFTDKTLSRKPGAVQLIPFCLFNKENIHGVSSRAFARDDYCFNGLLIFAYSNGLINFSLFASRKSAHHCSIKRRSSRCSALWIYAALTEFRSMWLI
ncbi:putative IS orf [Escherichia coli]|nr:putative IS orf [Escherichia coli]